MPSNAPTPTATRAQTVHRLAESLGFARVGIAPVRPSERADFLRAWLADGKHADMSYLADPTRVEQMVDVTNLVPGAKAIICVADLYATGATDKRTRLSVPGGSRNETLTSGYACQWHPDQSGPATGRIARYAWGDDYHRTIKNRLHQLADSLREAWPEHTFLTTVDTAAVMDREHAARAGLGWIGKNTLLLNPSLGSWLVLGEIITTLPLQTADESPGSATVTDHCGTCTRCIDACPTRCITPYSVDASRCISYLTIEHRGVIDASLHAAMGDWIAGCDVCQEVCPFNDAGPGAMAGLSGRVPIKGTAGQAGHGTLQPSYTPRPPAPAIPLLALLNWDPAAREAAFRRSALKRIKLEQLKRNAVIAAGNYLARHDDPALCARIRELAADASEPELVRATAAQVLSRLSNPSSATDS